MVRDKLDESDVGREVEVIRGGSGLVGRRGRITKVEPSGRWVRVAFSTSRGSDSFSDRFPIAHLKPVR